jgi:hypothetical protein
LINPASRRTTIPTAEVAVVAEISPAFEYERAWCFKSLTGFTALGLRKRTGGGEGGGGINGVIHAAGGSLDVLDARETGYSRVEISLDAVMLSPASAGATGAALPSTDVATVLAATFPAPPCDAVASTNLTAAHVVPPAGVGAGGDPTTTTTTVPAAAAAAAADPAAAAAADPAVGAVDTGTTIRLWTYVPNASQCASPSEEYPIVQTYLDVVLEGCLAEGTVVGVFWDRHFVVLEDALAIDPRSHTLSVLHYWCHLCNI